MLNKHQKNAVVCLLLSICVSVQLFALNPVDEWCARPYDSTISTVSTLGAGAMIAAPGLLAVPLAMNGQWGKAAAVGIEYGIVFGGSWGTKELLKNSIIRQRPYMAFDGYPAEKVADGEFERSFPSGHATLSFAAAGFGTWQFCNLFPEADARLKWAVGCAAFGGATAVAVLRVASGSHYVTDVGVGAVIGTLWGLGVPAISRWIKPVPGGFVLGMQW